MTEQTTPPQASVTVNALQASDYAAWQRLGAGYNRFYEREFPAAIYERTWQRLMQGDGIHGFAARVENERAWKVDIAAIKAASFNLDQKNPHAPGAVSHDPDELLREYGRQQAEAQALRNQLKAILAESLAGGWA